MFLDYNGTLYLANKSNNISELWFAAKNNLHVTDPLVKLWSTSKMHQCRYSDEIMAQLDRLDHNVFTPNISPKASSSSQ